MEEWRKVLKRLADRLPDVEIPPPEDDAEDDPELHRGESILLPFRAGIGCTLIEKGPAST